MLEELASLARIRGTLTRLGQREDGSDDENEHENISRHVARVSLTVGLGTGSYHIFRLSGTTIHEEDSERYC